MTARQEINFSVLGVPASQGSTRAFVVKGHAVTTNQTPDLKAWRSLVASEAQNHAPPVPFQGAVYLRCDFVFIRPKSRRKTEFHVITRPDLDKLARAVMDALSGVLYRDDSQVASLTATKTYARNSGVTVRLYEAAQPPRDIISDGSNDIIIEA